MGKPVKIAIGRLPARAMGPMSVSLLPAFGRLRRVTLARVLVPPGADLPGVRHRKTDEIAYILSGGGSGVIGGRRVRFKKGDALLIPAGALHRFRAGRRGTEILDIFGPALDRRRPDVAWEKPPAR